MNRILTFAEFSKSFDAKGTELGNSPADVEALAKSTDQFTADGGNTGSCEDSDHETPEVVDGGGEKVIALAVQGEDDDDEPAEEEEREFEEEPEEDETEEEEVV